MQFFNFLIFYLKTKYINFVKMAIDGINKTITDSHELDVRNIHMEDNIYIINMFLNQYCLKQDRCTSVQFIFYLVEIS